MRKKAILLFNVNKITSLITITNISQSTLYFLKTKNNYGRIDIKVM